MLAQPFTILIYSTSDSILLRSLPLASNPSQDALITGYVLSPTEPNWLYVATAKGLIYKWDWKQGVKLGRWHLGSPILSIAVGTQELPDGPIDIVYTQEETVEGKPRISVHKLRGGEKASETESKTIFQFHRKITDFKVAMHGKFIMLAAGPLLIAGHSMEGASSSLRDTQYTWREFNTFNRITSFDVRHASRNVPAPSRKTKSKQPTIIDAVVNVVVGHEKGEIFIYEDLLRRLFSTNLRGPGSTEGPILPRKLHWHREQVCSVTWSLDGEFPRPVQHHGMDLSLRHLG